MFNRLNEIIKKFKGNVLTICVDDKLFTYFDKNDKINLYSISRNLSKKALIARGSKMSYNKGKTINIKKIKKYIRKKSIDYIIINIDEVYEYYKYIVRDTILLSKNKIYVYGTDIVDFEFIKKLYSRYNTDINISRYKDSYLMSIKNNDVKRNYLKNKLYFIEDTMHNISEFIGNILVS